MPFSTVDCKRSTLARKRDFSQSIGESSNDDVLSYRLRRSRRPGQRLHPCSESPGASDRSPRGGAMSTATLEHATVEGHVSRGFEAVRDAFVENFTRRGELGGACCAYHDGKKVVDLWGGIRNKQTREP